MSDSTRARRRSVEASKLHHLLTALGHRPAERVSICTQVPGGRFTPRIRTIDGLTSFAPNHDADVWFGPNGLSRNVAPGRKGTDADIVRVRALFADLDYKDGSLRSIEECERVVRRLSKALGVLPTALVYSGGGLQPYWRVASPRSASSRVAAERDGSRLDREQWRLLYQRWGGLVQAVVASIDPTARVDNVYQLSHIMRCPGTVNQKYPACVVTEVCPLGEGITWKRLLEVVDRDRVGPLSGQVRPLPAVVRTSMSDAVAWVQAQPGANASAEDMRRLGPHRAMLAELDEDAVLRLFISGNDDVRSAHDLMRDRVMHVVLKSTENVAGLELALGVIERAYVKLMELRRSGRVGGDRRSDSVALSEFDRALRGAVERAKARGNSPAPQRDSDGRIVLRTRLETGRIA